MKMFVFDGSVDEITMTYQKLKELDAPLPNSVLIAPKPSKQESTEGNFMDLAQAGAVLTRRPLSAEQLTVLKLLRKQHPRLVSAIELREAVTYTKAQFAGMMGAFGRRVAHTAGVKGKELFRWGVDKETDEYTYGLPDSVIEAMNTAGF